MKKKSVLLGLSGGIDSFVSALLLQDSGYEVVAQWVDMLGSTEQRQEVETLCTQLGIELHIADAKQLFEKEVIEKVLGEHSEGKTPSPCTICNERVKFKTLWESAQRLKTDHIATGHYIRIETLDSRHYIKKGVDPIKDQSYYLWALGTAQAMLGRLLTPLGGLTKVRVREIAANRGYEELTRKAESQSLCFARGGYSDFLQTRLQLSSGDVLNCNSQIVGTHRGAALYTIGQKRGYTLHDEKSIGRVEVRGIDAQRNTLVVGEPLLTSSITIGGGWFAPKDSSAVRVRIRGLGQNPEEAVEISGTDEGGMISIGLREEKFWAPTAGQPAVLYQGDCIVGGGIVVG